MGVTLVVWEVVFNDDTDVTTICGDDVPRVRTWLVLLGRVSWGTEVRMVWERTTWAARVPDTWESRKDRISLLHDDNGAVSMDIPCTSLITLVINIHVHNIDVNYQIREGPIKRD